MRKNEEPLRSAYSIFIETAREGRVPAWHDIEGYPVVYETEHAAQREIAEFMQMRLQEFLDGFRDFDDAMTLEDFILPVDIWPDRSISIEDGTVFHRKK